jgi:hypothetical protein
MKHPGWLMMIAGAFVLLPTGWPWVIAATFWFGFVIGCFVGTRTPRPEPPVLRPARSRQRVDACSSRWPAFGTNGRNIRSKGPQGGNGGPRPSERYVQLRAGQQHLPYRRRAFHCCCCCCICTSHRSISSAFQASVASLIISSDKKACHLRGSVGPVRASGRLGRAVCPNRAWASL